MTDPAEPVHDDRVTTSRTRLYDALLSAFPEPDGAAWFTRDRVFRYKPPNVTSPCVWIDRPRLGTTGGRIVSVTATYPVVVAVNGGDWQQLADLDHLAAVVYDVLDDLDHTRVVDADPDVLVIDDYSARTVVFLVVVDMLTRTFCPETLAAAS